MAQPNRQLVIESTEDQAATFAATIVETIICEAAGQRKTCSVALAGGTTPHTLYQHLAASGISGDVPWSAVEVFFGDERAVPHDDIDSNYRMAQRTLLDNLPIEPSRVHPMPADADNLQAAAVEYEQTIRRIVPAGAGGIPRFDLVLLGMGADGHTASLFPRTDALNERNKLVTAYFVPVLGRNRMTFTYPLINAARNIMLLVTGEDKADAIGRLLAGNQANNQDLPVGNLNPTDGKFFIIVDAAAGKNAQTKT
jgi:6-phosphogluconolactonase